MPGRHYDNKTKSRFQRLITEGISVEEAAKRIDVSLSTGYRWARAKDWRNEGDPSGRASYQVPDPRGFDDLPDIAKRIIDPTDPGASFDLFSEAVFCRRPVPWRRKAALVSLDAILDRGQKHFVVSNEPPGVGKSTLWELDIPAWLLCGGGTGDPKFGRALRFMFGHESKGVAKHYVQRLARVLESPRPYYDKEQARYADISLAREFGRFRPWASMGDVQLWREDQFVVAQLQDVDLYEKEPTVQSASRQAGFLGERADYIAWDDLVTKRNSKTVEALADIGEWFDDEAEPRLEPGGVLWLIGQRLGRLDLFQDRVSKQYEDDEGQTRSWYIHLKFPLHNEPTCDGAHRQWDAEPEGDGCLIDAVRYPWREVKKLMSKPNFRTVYQQEDTDPASALVLELYLDGGTSAPDEFGETRTYPGCWDRERGFGDFPARVDHLINYASVDPSVSGNYAAEWWATTGVEATRHLIYGFRGQMQAGDLLDWDEERQEFTGLMERWQKASVAAHQPIRTWVVESVSAFKHLFEYRHFHRWKQAWPFVQVIPHQTQKNKLDDIMGVEALLRHKYSSGMASLPRKHGDIKGLNYINAKKRELLTWPDGATDDTVMCDWFGEANIQEIVRWGRKPMREFFVDVDLPPYLQRQRREVTVRR